MKINEITDEILLNYLNAYEEDLALIKIFKDSAINYIKNYTKITDEKLLASDDITIVVLALISHFYENRSLSFDKNTDVIIDNILKLHDCNW